VLGRLVSKLWMNMTVELIHDHSIHTGNCQVLERPDVDDDTLGVKINIRLDEI
jgi:hypothetical protein